jgi:hypothetical protein
MEPFEFVIPERPVSQQARRQARLREWKEFVAAHARLAIVSRRDLVLRILGQRARLPVESLPSSTLIRELYSAGEISRQHFESIMRFLPIRNRLVHGVGAQESLDVEELASVVRALLTEVTTVAPRPSG